jgi:hypothetical protein
MAPEHPAVQATIIAASARRDHSNAIVLAARGANGWQRRQLIVWPRRRRGRPLMSALVASIAAQPVAAVYDSRI